MEEIMSAKPADDPTLQAMTICYREMQKRKASIPVTFLYLVIYWHNGIFYKLNKGHYHFLELVF